MMINWEGFGGKQSWPNFKLLSRHEPRRTEETYEKPQASRSTGRELNPRPPEYDAGVLTTQPRRSVEPCGMLYSVVS
jgi:hypothetical protein